MNFEAGQKIVYMKFRDHGGPDTDVPATYCEQVPFGLRGPRHKIESVDRHGKRRYLYVGMNSIRDAAAMHPSKVDG